MEGRLFHERGTNQLKADEREELIAHLEKMLETLKFGSITLVVQDGKIVQLEKNEKVRLQQNKNR
ncbi:YezD family protein [Neobacillus sp. NPDC097160]|uniref:YezD family protein n=1 Tax=Bacillus salipaludis TaxID=2547811 RepID=A0ABW8RDC3_9BACI